MHVLEVPAKVPALGEGLLAHRTVERSLTCVLTEMISQVAALLENTVASAMLAFEIELDTLSDVVFYMDGLMPLLWDALEWSGLDASDHCIGTELRLVTQVVSRRGPFLRVISIFAHLVFDAIFIEVKLFFSLFMITRISL